MTAIVSNPTHMMAFSLGRATLQNQQSDCIAQDKSVKLLHDP